MAEENKNIIKSTFLFAIVQIVGIASKVVINKFVAIFLGGEGIGIIGIYNNLISLIRTGAGLGVSQSAVKDISEANHISNKVEISRIIYLVKRITIYTSVLGVLTTIVLAPFLSYYIFGNFQYLLPLSILSIAVGFGIISEGQLAILKGMRELRSLAKTSVISSLFLLIIGLPLYYFFEYKGIVISLVLAALGSVFINQYFMKNINNIAPFSGNFGIKQVFKECNPMIKMGISLMLITFLGLISDLIIASYINKVSGTETYGYFQAGMTIVSSYFGIVLTAITTDYYPRISAINSENDKLGNEVNRQSNISLVMALPLVITFLFLSSEMIGILYSEKFLLVVEYTNLAVIGMVIIICSNNMGMILLAKQNSKVFLTTAIFQRILNIILSIFLFNRYGLLGLGISYLIMAVIHIVLMSIIMGRFYNINWKYEVLIKLLVIILLCSLVVYSKGYMTDFVRYLTFIVTLSITTLYSYLHLKKEIKQK